MADNPVFTFWEGPLPEYIKVCMETWKFPYVVLNYINLHEYTDFNVKKAKRFSMPQFADCVRVHVLRDNGGYWLDADTVMLSSELPTVDVLGNPKDRSHTIGYLHTEKDSDMYCRWAEYQDTIISNPNSPYSWDILGNAFTNKYIWEHRNITIDSVLPMHPEEVLIQGDTKRINKYKQFYFNEHYGISDLPETAMLMLHNSWTPLWYKNLNRYKLLKSDCTLSNILRELVGG